MSGAVFAGKKSSYRTKIHSFEQSYFPISTIISDARVEITEILNQTREGVEIIRSGDEGMYREIASRIVYTVVHYLHSKLPDGWNGTPSDFIKMSSYYKFARLLRECESYLEFHKRAKEEFRDSQSSYANVPKQLQYLGNFSWFSDNFVLTEKEHRTALPRATEDAAHLKVLLDLRHHVCCLGLYNFMIDSDRSLTQAVAGMKFCPHCGAQMRKSFWPKPESKGKGKAWSPQKVVSLKPESPRQETKGKRNKGCSKASDSAIRTRSNTPEESVAALVRHAWNRLLRRSDKNIKAH